MTKRRKRRQIRSITIFAGIEFVMLVVLAGIFWICGTKYSNPERILKEYCQAVMEKDWNEVYDLLNVPKTSSLSKKMFVNARRNDNREGMYLFYEYEPANRDMTVQEYEKVNGVQPEAKGYYTRFVMDEEGNAARQVVTLVKTGKKLLFFDEWKVSPRIYIVSDVGFTLPKGAAMTLNGISIVVEKKPEGNWQKFAIPYLFKGSYQMEVAMDGMETYRQNLSVREDGQSMVVQLLPEQTSQDAILVKAGQDIESILAAAFTKKSFGTISDSFAPEALTDGSIQQAFNELKNIASNGGEEGITWVEIGGLQETLTAREGAYDSGEENDMVVSLQGTVHEKFIYMSEEINALANDERQFTIQIQSEYTNVNGQWKLTGLPVTAQMF